jgi:hypothetical protein
MSKARQGTIGTNKANFAPAKGKTPMQSPLIVRITVSAADPSGAC